MSSGPQAPTTYQDDLWLEYYTEMNGTRKSLAEVHYERGFESVLHQEAERLFAGFYFVPFKATVYSYDDLDARAPDFALIHKDYRTWWVGEVELGHHSFDAHVLPQVRTLSRAGYGPAEVSYLCRREPMLDRTKVVEMFKGSPPRVLVVVNAPVAHWAERLRTFDAIVLVCQIFRSRLNRYVLRINGEYPALNDDIVTTCECEPGLHRMLNIDAPTRLSFEEGERVMLYYEGQASEWERLETSDHVFLHAVRDHNLQPGRPYEIVRSGDGTLSVRERKRQQGQNAL